MKNYTKPYAEITEFNTCDIITASGDVVSAGTLAGSDLEMYEIYQQSSSAKNTNVSVFTW